MTALNDSCETRESFALRRIAYVLTTAQWYAGAPTKWRLLRLAGIREEIYLKPAIQSRVDQALLSACADAAGIPSDKQAA